MRNLKLLFIFLILTACKAKYPALTDGLYVDIQTNKGDILLNLHYQKVPMTVANFVALAEGNHPKVADSLKGIPFYNGVKFHRVIKNFMIQGGDRTGTGSGEFGYKFEDEFPLNDDAKLIYKHDKAGVLSMANAGVATNSTQFFITHKDTPWLDGRHTVFGQVEIGQSVVDTIAQNDIINKVDIIRVGKEAKEFNAPKVFLEELENLPKRKAEKEKKIALAKERFKKKMGIEKSVKMNSGLQVLKLKEGRGKKVNPNIPTTVHYTLYADNGKKIDSSVDRKMPFTFTLSKGGLISGWVEGVKMMREGEKNRLFIPSYLGYGKVGKLPVIKPNTDLIFEIEVLKVGK